MQPTQLNVTAAIPLCVSLEVSVKSWKVALTDGQRLKPSLHKAEAVDPKDRIGEVLKLIEQTKLKWGLPANFKVALVYEAGLEGFWIYWALCAHGLDVMVVDPASIPVARQARRAKTDRLDAVMLLNSLTGYLRGERDRMRVVHVPSEEAEAQRHLSRDRGQLQKEVGQHRDRLVKLLRTQGIWLDDNLPVEAQLAAGTLRCWNGKPLPQELRDRLEQECERLALVKEQLKKREKTLIEQLPQHVRERIGNLMQLRGVGPVGAMRLVLELFWRDFTNRRQVGACVGLVPQPYDSGDSHRDQGISKQGNRRVRSLLIEMAWMWLRYQPNSEIAQWYLKRTTGDQKRGKRIAIVAVARRLAIALWRYVQNGVVPLGAEMKKA